MTGKVYISQSDRFRKNHGQVFRSSGMFYYRNARNFRSTITLWNHFRHKNNIDAALLASVRDMSGKLIQRERIGFDQGEVIAYRPIIDSDFEGSVEIEAFAAADLKIPFTAIAALYEAEKSSCALHAYGRVYSTHEIEEGRYVPVGREAGWTLRDAPGVRSFCVFHNGAGEQPPQHATLRVRNAKGECRTVAMDLPALPPFATVRIFADQYMPDIVKFLDGREGMASVDFHVNGAFTRMLVGNETADEFQVTHSNFNYSEHVTENLPASLTEAFMIIPGLHGRRRQVVVYPEFSPGQYTMSADGQRTQFAPGESVIQTVNDEIITFARQDGVLPARIVTGLIVDADGVRLPAEISLNVFHGNKPDKRLSWGICAAPDRLRTALVVTDLAPLKGGFPADGTMELRAYSAIRHDYLSTTLHAADMARLKQGVPFEDLIPGLAAHLGGATGFFSLYSDYGGLFCYTMIHGAHGSLSLEHSF